MVDPTWLGRSPDGNAWRYMHTDGRIEDYDPASDGLAGWAPPGFEQPAPEAAAPQVDIMDQRAQFASAAADVQQPVVNESVTELSPTTQPPPPTQSERSSTSSSSRKATLSVAGDPGAFSKSQQRVNAAVASDMALLQPAVDAQKAAATGIAESEAAQFEAKEQGFEREASALRDQNEARAREVADIERRSDEWTGRIKDAMESIPTIDSKKIFTDASTAQTAGMAISAFMGGFLQPVLGTNTPMDIINAAIDRSVNDQKAAQAQAQNNVENIGRLQKTDMDQAIWQLNEADIGRAGHLTALKREVEAKVMGFQSDIMRKQGQKLIADFDRQLGETYLNIRNTTRTQFETERHNQRMESIQSDQLAISRAAAQGEANGKAAKDLEERAIRNPVTGQVIGYLKAGTAAQAGDYNIKQAKTLSTVDRLFAFKKLQKNYGTLLTNKNFLKSAEGIELTSLYNDLLTDMAYAKSGASYTDKQLDQLKTIYPIEGLLVAKGATMKALDRQIDGLAVGQNNSNRASLEMAPLDEKGRTFDFNEALEEVKKKHGDDPATAPAFGKSLVEIEAAAQGRDPEASLASGVHDFLAEADAYPNAVADPKAVAKLDRAIATLEALPAEQRQVTLNPGGADEALRATQSGRPDIKRPFFGDAPVDALSILKSLRDGTWQKSKAEQAAELADATDKVDDMSTFPANGPTGNF